MLSIKLCLLRGSREFAKLGDYRSSWPRWPRDLTRALIKALTIERAVCPSRLPSSSATSDYEEVDARVTKFALIAVKSTTYSVPSRLLGHRLKSGSTKIASKAISVNIAYSKTPRLRRTTVNPHPRHVDFRHLLPGAEAQTRSARALAVA